MASEDVGDEGVINLNAEPTGARAVTPGLSIAVPRVPYQEFGGRQLFNTPHEAMARRNFGKVGLLWN